MWRQLTTQRLMIAVLFILIFAMAVRTPVDTDTWWHLRSGEYQLQNRTVVGSDLFSHTKPGEPWTNHSWGSQVVMTIVYRLAGSTGLALMAAILAAGGMAFIYAASAGSAYTRAFAIVLGAAAAAVFWSPRPQMFTFFFSTVVYYLLSHYKWQRVDRLWFIPLVVWLWGNMHAGFATAFILMFGFVVGETVGRIFGPQDEAVLPWRGIRRIVLIMVISIFVLVVNPFGLDMLKVPFATVNIGVLQDFIQEWASPNFHERQTWPFAFLLIGAFGFAGLSKRRIDWTDLTLVSGTAFLALMSGRNIALFAVVATPVLASHLEEFLRDRGWQIRPVTRVRPAMARLNWLLLALVLMGGVVKAFYAANPDAIKAAQETHLPVRVATYLNEVQPEGLMFNSYNWGGYLMFAAPDYSVYVDGRTDLYGDAFLREYLGVAFARDGWQEVLEERKIGFVVIEQNSLLSNALRDEPEWRVDYEDDMAVVFVRNSAS